MLIVLTKTIAALCGLGALWVQPITHPSRHDPARQPFTVSFLEKLVLLLGCGILLNYALSLLIRDLNDSILIGTAAALVGWSWVLKNNFRVIRPFGNSASGLPMRIFAPISSKGFWLAVAVALYALLAAAMFFKIMKDPLADWDARSIWFFHGKMIYYSGALDADSGFKLASVGFSHPDYPKMLPFLAAQLTSIQGPWNEFAPKFALFILFLAGSLSLLSCTGSLPGTLFLGAALLIAPSYWYANGYMDGYFALYCGVAVLAAGRWLSGERVFHSTLAWLMAGLAMGLKNEGLLFALSIIGSILLIMLLQKKIRLAFPQKFGDWAIPGLVLFSPVLWQVYKWRWGIISDLISNSSALDRLIERMLDGHSLWKITVQIWSHAGLLPLAVLVALLLIRWVFAGSPRMGAILCLSCAVIYGTGLTLVYLSTPNDLDWHLNTSVSRVAMTLKSLIYVGLFFCLPPAVNLHRLGRLVGKCRKTLMPS